MTERLTVSYHELKSSLAECLPQNVYFLFFGVLMQNLLKSECKHYNKVKFSLSTQNKQWRALDRG